MDRETFRDYFNVSPETYARQGWDMGRILHDLQQENGSTPGGWGEVANAAAALLEELGYGPSAPAPTELRDQEFAELWRQFTGGIDIAHWARDGWNMDLLKRTLRPAEPVTAQKMAYALKRIAIGLEERGFVPARTLVYCTTCGTAMERRDDPHGDPGRECWHWFNLAGGLADKCPGCGAITSALTTTVHPSTRSVLREVWDRRASVDEMGRGYDVHLDAQLCERIRVVLVHPDAHQGDDLAEIVNLLQRLTADERNLVVYLIRRLAGVPVG